MSVVLILLLVLPVQAVGGTTSPAWQPFERSVYVSAAFDGWMDSGVTLVDPDPVTVTSAGIAFWNQSSWVAPDGLPGPGGSLFPAPGLRSFSLVARIAEGDPVFIGSGPVVLRGTGVLYLAFNDEISWDNLGGFMVTITTREQQHSLHWWSPQGFLLYFLRDTSPSSVPERPASP